MRHTTFAGLDRLESGDPISTDGNAVTGRNVDTISQWLSQIVAHRHDGAPPIGNPSVAPTAVSSSTGGSLPPSTTLFATYTVVDSGGGETAAAPVVSFATPEGIGEPPDLASATLSNASGSLLVNTFTYVFTVRDATGGETTVGDPLIVDREPGAAMAQVVFTGLAAMLAACPGGVQWALYKAVGGAQYEFLVAGTSDTYTDDGLTAVTYGTQPPTSDTTNQTASVALTVPHSQASAGAAINIYLSSNESFIDPCLYGTFAVGGTDITVTVTALALSTGAPPPTSTAVRGAQPIDATTDLVNLLTALADVGVFPGSGGTGGGGGGDSFVSIAPAVYFWDLAAGDFNLWPEISPNIAGEFSLGADGAPNVFSIRGSMTLPMSLSGGTDGNGSAIIAQLDQSPWVINYPSGAASGLGLFAQVTVSNVDQSEYMVVFGSSGINPSDALGTTVVLDTESEFDWSQASVVGASGATLVWAADEGLVLATDPAEPYWVMGVLYAEPYDLP